MDAYVDEDKLSPDVGIGSGKLIKPGFGGLAGGPLIGGQASQKKNAEYSPEAVEKNV